MKYIVPFLAAVLLSSCSKPKTIKNCVSEVKDRIAAFKTEPKSKKERLDDVSLEMGIFILCTRAENDPDKALELLKG